MVLGFFIHAAPRALKVGPSFGPVIHSCKSSILAGDQQSVSWTRGLLFDLLGNLSKVDPRQRVEQSHETRIPQFVHNRRHYCEHGAGDVQRKRAFDDVNAVRLRFPGIRCTRRTHLGKKCRTESATKGRPPCHDLWTTRTTGPVRFVSREPGVARTRSARVGVHHTDASPRSRRGEV